jgi:hypothetical protein
MKRSVPSHDAWATRQRRAQPDGTTTARMGTGIAPSRGMTDLAFDLPVYNRGLEREVAMVKRFALTCVVFGSLLASSTARAEERGGLYANRMEGYYQGSVKGYASGIPSAYDDTYKPGECARLTAAEKKKGAKPGDTITGDFKGHPKAKPAGDRFSVPFSEAAAICTAHDAQLKIALGQAAIRNAAAYMKDKKGPATAADAKGFNSGAGDSTVSMGKDCIETIDSMIKAGAAPTSKLKIDGGEATLEDLKKTCQAAIEYGTAFNGFIAEEQKAKLAEKAKKYEAAGIKGARLALFIEYDDVYWRNTKCEKTDDVAELAKAKVLIHWLENSDGTQTIRRYTFNGDKVSKTEKNYITESAAQRGCR